VHLPRPLNTKFRRPQLQHLARTNVSSVSCTLLWNTGALIGLSPPRKSPLKSLPRFLSMESRFEVQYSWLKTNRIEISRQGKRNESKSLGIRRRLGRLFTDRSRFHFERDSPSYVKRATEPSPGGRNVGAGAVYSLLGDPTVIDSFFDAPRSYQHVEVGAFESPSGDQYVGGPIYLVEAPGSFALAELPGSFVPFRASDSSVSLLSSPGPRQDTSLHLRPLPHCGDPAILEPLAHLPENLISAQLYSSQTDFCVPFDHYDLLPRLAVQSPAAGDPKSQLAKFDASNTYILTRSKTIPATTLAPLGLGSLEKDRPTRSTSEPSTQPKQHVRPTTQDPARAPLNGVSIYFASKTECIVLIPGSNQLIQLTNSQKIRGSASYRRQSSDTGLYSPCSCLTVTSRSCSLKEIEHAFQQLPFTDIFRSASLEGPALQRSVQELIIAKKELTQQSKPQHEFQGGKVCTSGAASVLRAAYPEINCYRCQRVFRGPDRRRKFLRHCRKVHNVQFDSVNRRYSRLGSKMS
jgi:uncharacterized C2H2 Zn-finger protein